MSGKARFNAHLDEVLARTHEQRFLSSDFRAEFTNMVGLCRSVADYDLLLARQLFLATMMLIDTTAIAAIEFTSSR